MENNISQIQSLVINDEDYIDLIDTNFVRFRPQALLLKLQKLATKYFSQNSYLPDSKGLLSAREAISKYYSKSKLDYDKDKIFITASTSESYSLLFNLLKSENAEVLLPNPTYPLFEHLSDFSNIKPIYYKLVENDNWQPDVNDIKESTSDNTKFLVLISPNNPTGSIINKKNITEIFEWAESKGITVLIDEVFNEFTHTVNSTVVDINKYKTKVFLLNGISKMLASPDLKLAWIIANDFVEKDLLEELELANDCYLNANYFTQFCLAEILTFSTKVAELINPILKKNTQQLIKMCNENPSIFECNKPQAGIHVMLNVNIKLTEEELVCKLLTEKKVNVHPGYFYDYQGSEPTIVISLLENPENFKKGLFKIEQFGIQYKESTNT